MWYVRKMYTIFTKYIKYMANIKNVYYICIAMNKMKIMDESTKRKRFTKVATNRVQKIIDYLALLQNCSNRNNYEYDEDDVNHMFDEISKALRESKAVYTNEMNKASGKGGFSFNK